ncbi:glyoxylase-like metal-dependent hydrolase (beta-lactamase superfamily II) [Aneurinibacillus soli]|uniref:Hydroxyacylglutathione hydrolase n=1 Tax=Aneurinibacillus soli TaxID=1500254 RepID=A0A0U4NKR7_9BACL|nr:MBL fold metallo-hydrolase [Aneurinibacillus soli]PYE59699.1 glyoxylase-like metal-dependent hydrolase (beta-lactamase superfamily II) [Aneurinibacillus soli]BAU29300.1 Hydroxyacylglutathione hydrolase [Aneurinibacillus soli]
MGSIPSVLEHLTIPTPFNVGPVHIFWLKGEDGWTLVDTGPKTPDALICIERFMQTHKFGFGDIARIVLTHQHVDHSGLAAFVAEKSGASILAHEGAIPYIERDPEFMDWHHEFFRRLYRENGVPEEMLTTVERFQEMMDMYADPALIHGTLADGDGLPGHPDWRTVYTPGHTQNHIALYCEADGLMLSGDFLIKEISSNAFIEPALVREAERPKPLLVYRDTLYRIASMPIKRMLSAHGSEIDDPRGLIQFRLQRQEERATRIAMLLAEGPLTVFELSAHLFPKVYKKEMPLTFSEILGHLDLLERNERVQRVECDGIIRYKNQGK